MSTKALDVPPAPDYVGIHHAAFLCRDAEETRRFYEEILGFKLVAAIVLESGVGLAAAYAAELGDGTTSQEPRNLLTMFIEVAPGQYVTFFDLPHSLAEEKFGVRDGVEDYHLAFEVKGRDELMQLRQRLEAMGVAVSGPVDLQANYSIYFYDPNGIHLEVTIRSALHDDLYAFATQAAPDSLAQWMLETKAQRETRLNGADAVREQHEQLKRRVIERITTTVSQDLPATAGSHE